MMPLTVTLGGHKIDIKKPCSTDKRIEMRKDQQFGYTL
jgi:hypothetical protein